MSTSEKGIIVFVIGLATFGIIAFLGPGPLWGLLGGALSGGIALSALILSHRQRKQAAPESAEGFAGEVSAVGTRSRDALALIAAELPESDFRKRIEEILPAWGDILRNLDSDPSTALEVSDFHSSVADSMVSVARSYLALRATAASDPDSAATLGRAESQMAEMPGRFRAFLSELESGSRRHLNVELDILDDHGR